MVMTISYTLCMSCTLFYHFVNVHGIWWMTSRNNFGRDENYVWFYYILNWLEKYYFESCFINLCLWSIIRNIRSVKIYIFCNNGIIGWPLVSKHKHDPLNCYWRNGIVSSYISSYKCSHILDDQAKLIWEKIFFRISSLTNDIQDPKINSPPHRHWQLLSSWLKQKQEYVLLDNDDGK